MAVNVRHSTPATTQLLSMAKDRSILSLLQGEQPCSAWEVGRGQAAGLEDDSHSLPVCSHALH